MAIQDTDTFLVNRGGQSYKVSYGTMNVDAEQALTDAAAAQATADQALALAQSLDSAGGEYTITASSFDLSQGDNWTCGAIAVPNPTGATVGQGGLIRITAGPVVWGGAFKFPGGVAPTLAAFPAVIPYYVQNGTTILMGQSTEGIV